MRFCVDFSRVTVTLHISRMSTEGSQSETYTPREGEPRKASLLGAVMIVVGNMIGIGVFTSLGFQVSDLPSGFAIVMLWAAGGVVAFCGAVCYAELVGMFPRSGGEYHLLRSAFHPLPGFMAGWVSIIAGFPAPVALAASAFGSYFAGSVFDINATFLGVALIVLVTAVHLVNVTISSRFQIVATIGKAALIVVLIVCAFSVADPQPVSFLPRSAQDWQLLGTAGFGTALLWVHYSFEGWNGAAYVAGEVKNPRRNVPIALLFGTVTVTLLYIGINAGFLYAAPISDLTGKKDVARVAAGHIFGGGWCSNHGRSHQSGVDIDCQCHDMGWTAHPGSHGRRLFAASIPCTPERERHSRLIDPLSKCSRDHHLAHGAIRTNLALRGSAVAAVDYGDGVRRHLAALSQTRARASLQGIRLSCDANALSCNHELHTLLDLPPLPSRIHYWIHPLGSWRRSLCPLFRFQKRTARLKGFPSSGAPCVLKSGPSCG